MEDLATDWVLWEEQDFRRLLAPQPVTFKDPSHDHDPVEKYCLARPAVEPV